jgi:hypothetical protein
MGMGPGSCPLSRQGALCLLLAILVQPLHCQHATRLQCPELQTTPVPTQHLMGMSSEVTASAGSAAAAAAPGVDGWAPSLSACTACNSPRPSCWGEMRGCHKGQPFLQIMLFALMLALPQGGPAKVEAGMQSGPAGVWVVMGNYKKSAARGGHTLRGQTWIGSCTVLVMMPSGSTVSCSC